ncbi:hypothetical protein XENOCAPTIV_013650 [Xenoophorus captivus]|uniref:Fibronectin type-III domain-containing protein n=1 Tax=Xenoophorus captivus TaxID=1517983 RepID=A0ABV0QRP6_9TELE
MVTSPAPFQLLVDGEVTTTVLKNLSPLTEYVVNVYAVVQEVSSEPLKGTETTLPLPAVLNMNVYDETSSTMRVSWEAAAGATGYLLLYRSINASEPQLEQESMLSVGTDLCVFSLQVRVAGGVTNTQLVELIPNTEYSITLSALHGESTSDALDGRGVTCT